MKKRAFTLMLAMMMILSAVVVVPLNVSAADTWDSSATNIIISTQNDWNSFVTYADTNNCSGKTITLATDVVFGRQKSIARDNWGNQFKGTLDGAGHSIDLTKTLGAGGRWNGGIFTELGNGCVIKNLKLTGTVTIPKMWEGDAGNRTYFGGIASVAHDTVTIENVYNNLTIVKPATHTDGTASDNTTRSGGFIGTVYSDAGAVCNLTFNGCIFDGSFTNNIGGGGTSAFVGHTGYKAGVKNLVFKNCVVGGAVTFTATSGDCRGVFVGYTQINGNVNITFQDTLVFTTVNLGNVNNDGYLFGSGWGSNVNSVTFSNLYMEKNTNQNTLADYGSGITTKTGNITGRTTAAMITEGTSQFSNPALWGTKTKAQGDQYSYLPLPAYWAAQLNEDSAWAFDSIKTIVATKELLIETADDLMNFASAVNGGNAYAGYDVKLGADIDLSGKTWTGIGATSSKPFSGNFDGQGHTIKNLTESVTNPDGTGGLFNFVRVPANKTITIGNFKLEGQITLTTTQSGKGYSGTVISTVDAGLSGNGGTLNLENVWSDVDIQCKGNITYIGGFIGFTRHQDGLVPLTLKINGCIYSGTINCANQATLIGGFLGATGQNKASRTLVVNFNDSLYAGTIQLNDEANQCSAQVGNFVGYINGDYGDGKVSVNVKDSASIGTITWNTEKTWEYGNQQYGVVGGRISAKNVSVSVENFYYTPVNCAILKIDSVNSLPLAGSGTVTANGNGSKEMTKRELAKLTASKFTDGSKWSFDAGKRVPAPVQFASNTDLLKLLKVDPLGVTASYRDTATNPGVLFTAEYFDTFIAQNGGTLDANFGIILISETNYNAAGDKTTVNGLMAAGAVCVKATRFRTTDEGGYTMSAVISGIPDDSKDAKIVAIAYVGDTLSASCTASLNIVNPPLES